MSKSIVPDDLLIPIGAYGTKHFGKCCDNWNDSEVMELRCQLPPMYHVTPVDALRRAWINIRKRGTDGYRVNGHGPSVGSRRLKEVPDEYRSYLLSDDWKERRKKWLDYWRSCCICMDGSRLDVHHRTYERVGHEIFTDCVVLCRSCHELFESNKSKRQMELC